MKFFLSTRGSLGLKNKGIKRHLRLFFFLKNSLSPKILHARTLLRPLQYLRPLLFSFCYEDFLKKRSKFSSEKMKRREGKN